MATPITGVRLWRTPRYSIVRVDTAGVSGYGECAGATEADLAAALAIVKGREATSYEIVRTALGANPAAPAINAALLDITGKLAKAPAYQVLGGPTRFKARVCAAVEGANAAAVTARMNELQKAGYRAFRVGLPAGLPAAIEMAKALRSTAAKGTDFILDAGARFSPGQASSLAAAVEKLHPLWIDEPCALGNLDAVAKIADESVAPLGFGRSVADVPAFQNLLTRQVVDILRPDINRHGISSVRRAAMIAETYYTAVAPFHAGGKVGAAAALHLAASIPNFFLMDLPPGTAAVKDGFAELPAGPGLGVTVDEKEFA
jgi:galactonate dehydratase